jgi:Ca2+-binding RTX toxin-like protein
MIVTPGFRDSFAQSVEALTTLGGFSPGNIPTSSDDILNMTVGEWRSLVEEAKAAILTIPSAQIALILSLPPSQTNLTAEQIAILTPWAQGDFSNIIDPLDEALAAMSQFAASDTLEFAIDTLDPTGDSTDEIRESFDDAVDRLADQLWDAQTGVFTSPNFAVDLATGAWSTQGTGVPGYSGSTLDEFWDVLGNAAGNAIMSFIGSKESLLGTLLLEGADSAAFANAQAVAEEKAADAFETIQTIGAQIAAENEGVDVDAISQSAKDGIQDLIDGLANVLPGFGGALDSLIFGSRNSDPTFVLALEESVQGSEHGDWFMLSKQADSFDGGVGMDVLFGFEGDDSLNGGADADVIDGGEDNDLITGGAGNDTLSGGEGDDTVQGGDDDDILYGGAGNDLVEGGAGQDHLSGDEGEDTLDGGAGDGDVVDYSNAGLTSVVSIDGVVVDLAAGTASDPFGDTDTIAGIEEVRGTALADVISGADTDDRLAGDDGADTLSGGAGNDSLNGGAGADLFVVRQGDGQIQIEDFELGVDTLDLSDFARADALAALTGATEGSAVLSFGDGTVLTVEGDGVDPSTLTESDLALAAAPTPNSAPEGEILITGVIAEGQNVTADITGVSDADGIRAETVSYQWQRNGSDIAGATAASYLITEGDALEELSVGVSYTDDADTDESISSAAVVPTALGRSVQGDEAGENLTGGKGDDAINGAGGNDVLTGAGGDDMLDGGDGTDRAIVGGPSQSYSVMLSANGITVTDRRADGSGTDELTDVEFLEFDGTVGGGFQLFKQDGIAGLDGADLETFVELYIAYFNRAPDAIGLGFWGTAFAEGLSLEEIAGLFVGQPETQAAYPDTLSNADFATAVYGNVLGRIPDQGGFDFWVGALDGGGVSRDQFILSVLEGAKASPPAGASQEFIDQQQVDRQYLADKTDIGAYFSVHKGMSDVADASAAMALFDGTAASITSAVNAIDGFYADALDADSGEFLLTVVGVLDDPFMAG